MALAIEYEGIILKLSENTIPDELDVRYRTSKFVHIKRSRLLYNKHLPIE